MSPGTNLRLREGVPLGDMGIGEIYTCVGELCRDKTRSPTNPVLTISGLDKRRINEEDKTC